MFWSLVKKIDQNKITSVEAKRIYEEIYSELDEEQQEILENKISELEEDENYWEISKKISSKNYYDEGDDLGVEDQLQEYEEYPFDDDTEPNDD